MNNILYDPELFKSISLDDCLNYIPYRYLETRIQAIVLTTISLINSDKNLSYSNELKINMLLEQVLLRVTTCDVWINQQQKYDLNQLYLYKVIKKYTLIHTPNLFQ